ncbi:thioesterase [Nonomuraea soli]|uniref:Surfactin synthase thioesterase subunit n=1 Tax=Nonomuraea soli TaxID=1032476 RepID=A0A7W0CVE1_9ACTN|nr:thioesterase [Nonomuraea soli]MBA2897858.1 surfactin synthase thioesterase subunit [Nonomuraea soli]
MFCLPFSGGGASAYNGLQRTLATHASAPAHVVPLQLPGRENRIAEPPVFSVEDIADEIAPATGEPYALYGHSMGARVAFEVVRELRRRGLPLPVRLYVGGAHPPHARVPLAAIVDLPDDAFIEQLIRRAGAMPLLRTEPEIQELLLPVLRADLGWLRRYRFRPEAPLEVPVVAFTGLGDHELTLADVAGWARHGTAGFRLRVLRGGHLFVRDDAAELAALIAADLAEGPPSLPWQAESPRPPRPTPGTAAGVGGEDEVRLWAVSWPGNLRPDTDAGTSDVQDSGVRAAVVRDLRAEAGFGPGAGLGLGGGPGVVVAEDGGLALVAVSGRAGLGVGVALTGDVSAEKLARWLTPAELDELDGYAEEDRGWLALRLLTAKRALAAAQQAGAQQTGAQQTGAQRGAEFPVTGRPNGRRTDGLPEPPDPRDSPDLNTLPDLTELPDLADPAPWPWGRGQICHLPLRTPLGDALAAVATPYRHPRLSLDIPAGQ